MKRIIISESQYRRITMGSITESKSTPNVLFIGDSQTKYNESYANKLINSGLIKGNIVAKNGASTRKMLTMLNREINKGTYDIISIMGGGNDGWRKDSQSATNNLKSMYEISKNSGAKVVAISNPTKRFISKSDNKNYRNKKYPSNESIGDWIESQNISDITIDGKSLTNSPQYFLSDMVHLNEQAHEKLKDIWYNIVLKDDYSDVGKEGNISTSIGGEEEINVEKGLEIFGQEGREAQEFLDSIESLLDQGEDILIEKQFDGGYSYDNRVEDLQTSLVLLGYELPIYGIDGLFGPETEMSVMEFQEDGGLTNDGIIDYETIERIILNLSEYSDEDINDFLKTSVGRGLNKYYDFGSYTEKVSPSKLLSDLNSELNNDNLSKALVANAVGESSLNVGIAGDSGEYAMKSERNRRRNVGGFCSFGLWQYNICGGLGVTLLDYYGVDVDDASPYEKMEVLSDYDKQVSFMINHVKRKGVVSQDKSVGEWIEWVVRKIEIPKDKESAIKKRIEHASRLGYLS